MVAKLTPRAKDLVCLYLSDIGVVLGTILVFGWVNARSGSDAFAEVVVVRRIITFVQPLLLLGLSVYLPRSLAPLPRHDRSQSSRVLLAAVLVMIATHLSLSAVALVIPGALSRVAFGASDRGDLVWCVIAISTALSLHGIAYGALRGAFAFGRAATLQFVNLGVLFGVCVCAMPSPVAGLLAWAATSGVTSATLIYPCITDWKKLPRTEIKSALSFGVFRMPADLLILGVFAAPIALTASHSSLAEAGVVAFGVFSLSIIGSLFVPFSAVMLPTFAKASSAAEHSSVRGALLRIGLAAVTIGLAVATVGILFGDMVVHQYLNRDSLTAIQVWHLSLWTAVPYALYMGLRGALEALCPSYVALVVAAASLLTFAISYVVSAGEENVIAMRSLLASTLVLAVGTACALGLHQSTVAPEVT